MSRIDWAERRRQMVAALKDVAGREGPDVAMRTFCERSGWTEARLYRAFRSWAALREAAGLPRWGNRWMANARHSRESLLAALAKAAAEFGPTVTRTEFSRLTGISAGPITRLFGSWLAFRAAGGLHERRKSGTPAKWSRDSVREAIQKTLAERGGQLTVHEFCEAAGLAYSTVFRHAGWEKTRLELGYFRRGCRGWLAADDPLNVLMPAAEWQQQLNLMLGRGDVGPAPAGRGCGGGVAGESCQAGA